MLERTARLSGVAAEHSSLTGSSVSLAVTCGQCTMVNTCAMSGVAEPMTDPEYNDHQTKRTRDGAEDNKHKRHCRFLTQASRTLGTHFTH